VKVALVGRVSVATPRIPVRYIDARNATWRQNEVDLFHCGPEIVGMFEQVAVENFID